MKPLYFASKFDEMCYEKEYFLAKMEHEGLDEMELFPALKYKEPGAFWCRHYEASGESGVDGCGKFCPGYTPRNGKSGCCVHYSTAFYEPAKEPIVLKRNCKV
jgi:hypothetical protein